MVHDIGQDLGCAAHVRSLERSSIGNVTLNDCFEIEDLADGNYKVLDVIELLGFPVVECDEKMMKRISNGNSLRNNAE